MTTPDPDFKIKRGDRLPTLRGTLRDRDGDAVDLSSAVSVKLYMRKMWDSDLVIDGSTVSVLDAPNGRIEYEWDADDTDDADFYQAEFRVEFAGSKFETFPNEGYKIIEVEPNIR